MATRLSGRSRGLELAIPALVGLCASQFAGVRATNFGGYDEWLIVSLTSRGISDIPYAHRPLELLWDLPAPWLAPHRLGAYLALHAVYYLVTALVLIRLVQCLAPAAPALAFRAAALSVAWAPLDFLRLNAVETVAYSGMTCATFASLLLFLESWRRRRPLLLLAAAVLAVLAALTYESAIPLLASAPLMLGRPPAGEARRAQAWYGTWVALMLGFAVLVVSRFLAPGAAGTYQTSALGLDPHPGRVLGRLGRQFGFHLLPLVRSEPRELLAWPVALAVAAFLVGLWLAARDDDPAAREGSSLGSGALSLLGLAWAAAAYAAFALSPAIRGPARTQILSAPGIALFLAAALDWVSGRLPLRPRPWMTLVALSTAWIVAVGTGRTLALQREWDAASAFDGQAGLLRELIVQAPALAPHTLVVLIDEKGAWPAVFTFRHAIAYLYPGQALGYVWRAQELLYPTSFTGQGVLCLPSPEIRRPWSEEPSRHGYDELVVVRYTAAGHVLLETTWPGDLPPLPDGARYAPEARIRRAAAAAPSARILSLRSRGPV